MIPDFGVFVIQNQLALDYRMGNDWTPMMLDGFFRLLLDLSVLDDKSFLSLEDRVQTDVTARFQQPWYRFRAENTSQ